MTNAQWGFETRQIHAGQEPDSATGARAVPVYRTTSYVFRDAQHAQNLFALAEIGNIYTRIMNPTQGVLEARLSSLEGGITTAVGLPGALAVSSGQSAELLAILTLAEAGSHIVASPSVYGGTYNLFHYTLPKLGIEVSFVEDPDNLDQWKAAAKPNTNCPDLLKGVLAGSADIGLTGATYAPLMAAKSVRKVSLTGSTRVGQQMIRDAAATLKKVSMELGGNAPVIVYDDADLDYALNMAVPTKFANAGQVCVTGDRFYVHESLHDAFVDGFVKRAEAIKLGDGLDPSVGMGPLINGGRLAEMEKIVAGAVAAGAKIVTGGARAQGFNAGHFFAPTVLTGCTDEMGVMADENFGPIAAITRFASEEEVLSRANASDMGLSAYAFTTSPARARRTVSALKAGMVGINSFAMAASEAPFGGTNHSGMGREGGIEGIRDYLDVKSSQMVWA